MSAREPGSGFTLGKLFTHLALLFLVAIWTLPTLGLLVSSLRDKEQLAQSGWWTAFSTFEQTEQERLGGRDDVETADGRMVLRGDLTAPEEDKTVLAFSDSFREPGRAQAGETIETDLGALTVEADGSYELVLEEQYERSRGPRVFVDTEQPPRFTLGNYAEVLAGEGVLQAFVNTFAVTIPATIIPILIAAFAAYAFSWMEFWGRNWIFAIVVGLLVVPLQMSLIPLLQMYNAVGEVIGAPAKSYPGIWLAHTGFGLPLAIYLLRNYIASLPKSIIQSARVDGASHYQIFMTIILPLAVPALASFAIFQFLWVWNDLLVALVFLGKTDSQIVLTSKLRELLGSRGDNWEILTASAFVSMIVPLVVFFALQRYFVRGLLAGSVKGG